MKQAKIYFFEEDIRFKLKEKLKYKRWIRHISKTEGVEIQSLVVVFTSDLYLLAINRQYLKKDSLTDVIAFDLHLNKPGINGEVYISIERVRENAIKYACSFDQELNRVIAHGVLHLLGYSDSTKSGKDRMRRKEDQYNADWLMM